MKKEIKLIGKDCMSLMEAIQFKNLNCNFSENVKELKNSNNIVILGNFDGVHRGHSTIFKNAVSKAKEKNYNIILTSDHGNCEMMKDDEGNTLTNHTVGDVYCFVIAENVKEVKTGSLNNIAPTVLKLMNLNIPSEMDEPLI